MTFNAIPPAVFLIAAMVLIVGGISAAFIVYAKLSAKAIAEGREDMDLTSSLKKKKAKSGFEGGYKEFLRQRRKKEKLLNALATAAYMLITVISLGVAVFAVLTRTRDGQFFIGDRAYVTIATGSMSLQNEKNPYYLYLKEHPEIENDMGQIPVNTLVEIRRADEYGLYDIVAFNYNGVTYMHRIVEITENGYTTMGDSNSVSLSFEKNMPKEMIVGVYGGQNMFFGLTLTFLKSDIGIITLAAIVAVLFMTSIAKSIIADAEKARTSLLAESLDAQKKATSGADNSLGT